MNSSTISLVLYSVLLDLLWLSVIVHIYRIIVLCSSLLYILMVVSSGMGKCVDILCVCMRNNSYGLCFPLFSLQVALNFECIASFILGNICLRAIVMSSDDFEYDE